MAHGHVCHNDSNRLPAEETFTFDRKADILTTQCEAYEVLKLQEVPQGHTHTDTGVPEEQAYVEVGDGLASEGCGLHNEVAAAGTRPQQQTTTQQVYEQLR